MTLERVCEAFGRWKYDLTSEHVTQQQIASALEHAGVRFEREYVLGDRERVDFLCAGGIAIEVKLRQWRAREVHRQVVRYCGHQAVTAMVLATGRSIGMPREINGKPVVVIPLGRFLL